MPRPTLAIAALLAGIAVSAAACASPVLSGTGPEEPDRIGQVVPSSRQARDPGPTRTTRATVRVMMNDRFRYRPDAIMVQAGRRVTFAVTNVGKLPHEFILGDRATQLDHERQMQAAATGGDHVHTHGPGAHATPASGTLTVPPGQTRRLAWTFDEPGTILFGCHVLGHWTAGMKGTIVVVAPAPGG
jgi:uncharacterized cupredoxin-like copper-binding protein